jgi:hypothetical protein
MRLCRCGIVSLVVLAGCAGKPELRPPTTPERAPPCDVMGPPPPPEEQAGLAPLYRSTHGVPSDTNLRRFMVVYRNDVPIDASALTRELAAKYGIRIYGEFVTVLQGFSAELSESVIAALRAHPSVASIAQNTKGCLAETQLNPR